MKKTPAEEERVLKNIEDVARDLSIKIGELNSFLDDLKSIRQEPLVYPKDR